MIFYKYLGVPLFNPLLSIAAAPGAIAG